MSEVHDTSERPSQYRAKCENCGKDVSDGLRMHSYLKKKHVKKIEGVEWDPENTQIQCNVCGKVKTFE